MPTVSTVPFPPPSPTISGELLTVSAWLEDPARVQRLVQDLSLQRFLADRIFGPGPDASSGAVVFDQVTTNDVFLGRDVHSIQPGGEYPILTDVQPTPLIAATTKWGGRVHVTDEDRDRRRIDVFQRVITKLRNTIVRKVDTVAIATLNAAPILTYAFGTTWATTSTDILGGLTAGRLLGDQQEMGYVYDTLIINDADAATLLTRAIAQQILGNVAQENLVRGATVGRILNFDTYQTLRVPQGTGYIVASRQAGGIANEKPLNVRTYRQEDSDKTWIQGGRTLVPYVTDPKAVIKITGL